MKNDYYRRRLKWWLIEDGLIVTYDVEVRRFALKLAQQLAQQQSKYIHFKQQITYQRLLKNYIRQVDQFEKAQEKR